MEEKPWIGGFWNSRLNVIAGAAGKRWFAYRHLKVKNCTNCNVFWHWEFLFLFQRSSYKPQTANGGDCNEYGSLSNFSSLFHSERRSSLPSIRETSNLLAVNLEYLQYVSTHVQFQKLVISLYVPPNRLYSLFWILVFVSIREAPHFSLVYLFIIAEREKERNIEESCE